MDLGLGDECAVVASPQKGTIYAPLVVADNVPFCCPQRLAVVECLRGSSAAVAHQASRSPGILEIVGSIPIAPLAGVQGTW